MTEAPSGVMVTIWSWPSSSALRVCPMKAATSEPRKFSPSPRPTTSGLLRRAPTTTPGCVLVDGEQREGALEAVDDRAHRLGQVAGLLVGARDEVRDDLGVGLGAEVHALGEELLLERVEVLDDPVVDQRQPVVGAPAVRVGVGVGGAAVGGPAGVADARGRRRQVLGLERLAQVGELAGPLLGDHPVSGDEGDTRRVIAAVLEPGQALHDDIQGLAIDARADVANDSTHGGQPSGTADRPCAPTGGGQEWRA